MEKQNTKLVPNIPVRCRHCRMHINLCFCDMINPISINTKVIVLMQSKEQIISTGTAHLIPKILPNAKLRFHGHRNKQSLILDDLIDSTREALLLYPFSGAKLLTPDFLAKLNKPISLFVPDGNWRQTSKMIKRTPELLKMQKVILPEKYISNYRLRKGPTPNHLCTFEAIAKAVGIIENKEVQNKLETIFNTMTNRVMYTRGKEKLKKRPT